MTPSADLVVCGHSFGGKVALVTCCTRALFTTKASISKASEHDGDMYCVVKDGDKAHCQIKLLMHLLTFVGLHRPRELQCLGLLEAVKARRGQLLQHAKPGRRCWRPCAGTGGLQERLGPSTQSQVVQPHFRWRTEQSWMCNRQLEQRDVSTIGQQT